MNIKNTINGWKKEIIEGTYMALAILVLISVIVFIYQCYLWLKTGGWVQLPIIKSFELIPGFKSIAWLYQPSDWLGVHKIIETILNTNTSIFLLLLAGLVFMLLEANED